MKRKTKILLTAIAVILLIAVAYLVKEYDRKPADVADIIAAEKTTAFNLLKAFEDSEPIANKKYAGNIIEVTGTISSIYNEADTIVNVLLETGDPLHTINCALATKEISGIKKYKPGQSITIKGHCTGFLLDVELNRCVITN